MRRGCWIDFGYGKGAIPPRNMGNDCCSHFELMLLIVILEIGGAADYRMMSYEVGGQADGNGNPRALGMLTEWG